MTHSKEVQLTRKEKKIQRNKTEILDIAEKLFQKHKFDDVIVDDIVERTVFSRATIYNYFHNKEGIYYSIGIRALEQINLDMQTFFNTDFTGLEVLNQLIISNMRGRKQFTLYNDITNRFLTIDKELGDKIDKNSKENNNKRKTLSIYEKILLNYLTEFRKFTHYWIQGIQRGITDGSIQIKGNVDEIIQFIFLLINGVVQIMDSNYLFHTKDALNENNVEKMTLEIVQKYLSNTTM